MSTAYLTHPLYYEHHYPGHVEMRERLEQIDALLDATGMRQRLHLLEPHAISIERMQRVHDAEHLAYIERTAKGGGGMMRNDNETYIAPASYDALRYAAGAVVTAIEAVLRGDFNNAFALVRPPGHHAFREHGEGFCLINNIAIAADTARHDLGMQRVLIVDFDVHHGNGTQAIFYDDPAVLFFSMQQWGIYPGSGHWSETGSGAGAGYTVNVPLLSGTGDAMYIRVFDDLLIPIARRFKPELILVSAGYDPHWADPLASMAVSDLGFFNLVKRLVGLSEELCDGHLVLTLEGGYGLEGLAYGVVATFNALLGEQTFDDPIGPSPRAERPVDEKYLDQLRALHGLS